MRGVGHHREMTDIPQVVADSDRLFDAVQKLVDGVAPDQWTAPTPCPDWNVRQLLHHVTNGNMVFAKLATGQRPAGPITPAERAEDWLGADPAAGFRASGKFMHEAFLTPGFLEGRHETPVMMGEQSGATIVHMRMNELLVHGWDLARATGQPVDLPEDLAEEALAMWQTRLGDRHREGMPFGNPVVVPDDSPAIDRLVAYLGRQP
jgi:uncharacterized protein (TIGR03086 family)